MSSPAALLDSVAPGATNRESVVLLEWYDFGRAEWTHVGKGALDFLLGTALPIGAFYVVCQIGSFRLAMLAVLGWSAGVFGVHYFRFRQLEVFSLTTAVLACIKAAAGLASGDVRVYLVWPSVENLLYGGIFLGSALLGHPVLSLYARRLYPIPPPVSRTAAFRRGFLGASIAWAAVSLIRASLRVWLAANLGVGTFLLVDSVSGWPVYLGLIWFSGWYPLRVLRQDGQVLP